jgi:hypothetical protein
MLLSVCSPLFAAFTPVFTRVRTHQLVCGILVGMMLAVGDITMTNVYLSLITYAPDTVGRYWSLEQVLRRRVWQVEDLIAAFVSFLLANVAHGGLRFIADATHTTTQGKKQEARSFRPNPHYRKGYQNQSKFLAGNDILSLSLVMDEATENGRIQRFCFSLGGVLLRQVNKRAREIPTFIRLVKRIVPKGMVILFDRAGNDAKTINALAEDYCYITRLNGNAVFYSDRNVRKNSTSNPTPWRSRSANTTRSIIRIISASAQSEKAPSWLLLSGFTTAQNVAGVSSITSAPKPICYPSASLKNIRSAAPLKPLIATANS